MNEIKRYRNTLKDLMNKSKTEYYKKEIAKNQNYPKNM